MAEQILFPEFRNEYAGTRYPFADTASLTTVDGSQSIAINTFQDATLYPIGSSGRMYISAITVASRSVTLQISDEKAIALCTSQFDPLVPPAALALADALGRQAGVLIASADRLALFNGWASGVYKFALGATEFVATACIPTPELGLRGILTEAGELMTGDIWLVGDNGVVLSPEDDGIRIDVVGDPLFVRKLCGSLNLFNPPLFIQTINGCYPDPQGDYQIVVGDHEKTDTALRISAVADGILQISVVGKT